MTARPSRARAVDRRGFRRSSTASRVRTRGRVGSTFSQLAILGFAPMALAWLTFGAPVAKGADQTWAAGKPGDRAALEEQVRQLNAEGRVREALPLARRVAEDRERTFGPNHPETAKGIGYVGMLLIRMGDYASAEPLLRRALDITERALGPTSDQGGVFLANLGHLFQDKGDYPKAEYFFRRALAACQHQFGYWHPETAACLASLGTALEGKGDLDAAEGLFRQALAVRERTRPAGHRDIAESLSTLGDVAATRGDYRAAEGLFRQSLAMNEKALGPDHPAVADSLNRLAEVMLEQGDLVGSEPLFRRALEIRTKAFGWTHPDVALEMNNIAVLKSDRGDTQNVEVIFRTALEISQRALGPQHPQVALGMRNLSALLQSTGRLDEAERLSRQALAIDDKVFGPESAITATAFSGLALVLQKKGDTAGAEEATRHACDIWIRAFGPVHPKVGDCLNNLGVLAQGQKDFARADAYLRRALAVYEQALGADHREVGISLVNLATLRLQEDRPSDALVLLERSSEIEERVGQAIFVNGSQRSKSAYLAKLDGSSWLMASLNAQDRGGDPGALRLALTTALRRKGRALEASAETFRALRLGQLPEMSSKIDQLLSLRSRLAASTVRGPLPNETVEKHREALEELRGLLEKMDREIGNRYGALRATPEVVSVEAVASHLAPGSVLVEIVRYRSFVSIEPEGTIWGAWRYVAYVVRPDGQIGWSDLGEAAAIDEQTRELRIRIANRDPEFVAAARALDERLIRPLRALIGDAEDVYLSPDGPLNLLPFAALVDERGQFLIQRYRFTFLTSGRDLLRLGEHAPARSGAIIVAAPNYDVVPATVADAQPISHARAGDLSRMKFRALPNTLKEAREIAAVLSGAKLLVRGDATEAEVKKLRAPSILHIATHGFFLDDDKTDSGDDRSARFALTTTSSDMPINVIEDPLLRSGLALAGANGRQSGPDDGILTALEVSGLDLWGTRLVVLSACETGVGKTTNGDGVYGLRRALVLAGAESQLTSLWKVDDEATRILFVDYYKRLKAGAGRSDALRQAQLALMSRRKDAHPYYWAAFVASGDPTPTSF